MAPCRRVPLDRPFLKQLATARRIVPSLAVNIAFSASATARSGSEELAALEQSSADVGCICQQKSASTVVRGVAFWQKRWTLSVRAIGICSGTSIDFLFYPAPRLWELCPKHLATLKRFGAPR